MYGVLFRRFLPRRNGFTVLGAARIANRNQQNRIIISPHAVLQRCYSSWQYLVKKYLLQQSLTVDKGDFLSPEKEYREWSFWALVDHDTFSVVLVVPA
jgi:hypothetical protein